MKLKLTWLLTLFMAFVMQFSFAQEKIVTGTITTVDDGLPLPGANVVVKGTSRQQFIQTRVRELSQRFKMF